MGRPPASAARPDGGLAGAPRLAWADVEIFHAVAETGTLGAAALALGLSETTVARRLKAFETALGVGLFTRGANRLIPTEAGVAMAAEAAQAAQAIARLGASARSARAEDDTPIRITATTSISLLLTRHAAEISAAAGGVEIVIISTRDRLDLARGDAEIAIRMHHPPEDAGYFSQKVGQLTQALYVRRGVDPATAPIISSSNEGSTRIDAFVRRWAGERPIAARVGDSSARYESIRRSGAVSMAPCFIADADPDLMRLCDPPEETADAIYLVSHASSRRRPAVLAALEALRRMFRDWRGRLDGREPPR